MLQFHTFQQTDLLDVIFIVDRTISEKYNPAIYAEMSAQWPEGFVLVKEGPRLIGLVFAIPASENQARIIIFCVEPGYQAKGIGSALLEELYARCRRRGLSGVRLEAKVGSQKVVDFYQKRGYATTGVLKRFYNSGDDAYSMSRPL
jgi:ribosomal protein S18 acetylase RimI-like enzyme